MHPGRFLVLILWTYDGPWLFLALWLVSNPHEFLAIKAIIHHMSVLRTDAYIMAWPKECMAMLAESPLEKGRDPDLMLHGYCPGKLDVAIGKRWILFKNLIRQPEIFCDVLPGDRLELLLLIHGICASWRIYKII